MPMEQGLDMVVSLRRIIERDNTAAEAAACEPSAFCAMRDCVFYQGVYHGR